MGLHFGHSSVRLQGLQRILVRTGNEMKDDIERNLGVQPIVSIMNDGGLGVHDLVAASSQQITHKMVSRACKGRRLTRRVQLKVLKALSSATEKDYSLSDLFNYRGL